MQHKKTEIFNNIIDYVNLYYSRHSCSPTVRDIAAGIGIAISTVCKYLQVMETNGSIVYDAHRRIMTPQMQLDQDSLTRASYGVPITGTIACGGPKEAISYTEDLVSLPKSIFGEGPLFVLHASGDSMIEAGIDEGDLVVIRQQNYATPGQIVVALIDDSTTLKGYFPEPEKQRIRLQPANSSMEPMYFDSVEIQGVAVSVIKAMNKM